MATVREIREAGHVEERAALIRFLATVEGWTEEQAMQYYRDYRKSVGDEVNPDIKPSLRDMHL